MDGKKDKPMKPKKKPIKKKSVKRKRKPAVKKSVTQTQTVTQNVKVLVNNIRQRRRNRRTLIDKQPLQQLPQQPAVITIAPTFSQPQPQIIQPQPQAVIQPQLIQPQPQAVIQPQIMQPQPQAVIQPQLTAQDRTVTVTQQPSLTPPTPAPAPAPTPSIIPPAPAPAPAPTPSIIPPTPAPAPAPAPRSEPPRPRPPPVGGLLGEIQSKAEEFKKKRELGEGAPKIESAGEITTPPRKMESDLMSQILKRGQELKPVSERVDKPKAKPAAEPKKTALDVMKEKLQSMRKDTEPEEELGAFSLEAEPIIKPQIEVVEAKPLLEPTGRESPTLEDLTEDTPPKKGRKKAEAVFIPVGEAKEGEPITLKQVRGTGEKTRGIPKEAEEAFKKYLEDYTIIEERPSSMGEAVKKTKSLKFKDKGELIPDFKDLMQLTGDSESSLKGKLRRAKEGKEIKIV